MHFEEEEGEEREDLSLISYGLFYGRTWVLMAAVELENRNRVSYILSSNSATMHRGQKVLFFSFYFSLSRFTKGRSMASTKTAIDIFWAKRGRREEEGIKNPPSFYAALMVQKRREKEAEMVASARLWEAVFLFSQTIDPASRWWWSFIIITPALEWVCVYINKILRWFGNDLCHFIIGTPFLC